MPEIKKGVERRGKRMRIERFVLHTLASCGVLTVAMVAPNVIGALKKLDREWESKIDPHRRVQQTFSRLKQKGFITFSGSGATTRLALTKKGQELLLRIDETRFHVRKPFRWDGRWRMVIFDIPEQRRVSRDMFRNMLQKVGFIRLQGSVWVYPYNCEEVVALIKADQHLGGQVIYAVVDALENDAPLRQHFKLPTR